MGQKEKNNLFHPFHYHNKRNQLSITQLIFNIFHFTILISLPIVFYMEYKKKKNWNIYRKRKSYFPSIYISPQVMYNFLLYFPNSV